MGSRRGEARPPKVEEVIAGKRERIATRRSVWRLLGRVLIIAAIGWAALTQVFGLYAVEGEDMYPRLRDGDLTVVYRLQKEYAPGDVVTYQQDGKRYFGRVVATGGDTVDLTDDGRLSVNGNIRLEEVFAETTLEGKRVNLPVLLHDFEVFVLGDNRTQAKDGRDFGTLPKANVEGVVMSVLRQRGI